MEVKMGDKGKAMAERKERTRWEQNSVIGVSSDSILEGIKE